MFVTFSSWFINFVISEFSANLMQFIYKIDTNDAKLQKTFVKLNPVTSFAFDLTKIIVKLNPVTSFASDLTENFVKWNTHTVEK